MSAGMKEAQRAHTGKSKIGESHGRPDVVPNVLGMNKVGKAEPYEIQAQRAMSVPVTTLIVGAKLEIVLRTVFVKKTPR